MPVLRKEAQIYERMKEVQGKAVWNEELRRIMLIDFEYGKVQKLIKDGTGKRALTERDENIVSKRGKHSQKVPIVNASAENIDW